MVKLVFISDENVNSDLCVSAELTYDIANGEFAVIEEEISQSHNLKIVISRWLDCEHGEEENLRRACYAVFDYAIQNSCKNIVFDTKSFADDPVDITYFANVLTEELSDIARNNTLSDLNVTVLLRSCECDEELLNELDDELSKPIIQTENHAYGDYGDPLKKDFEEFQKKLSKKKTFREYLVDIMNLRGVRKGSEVYRPAGVSKSTFSKIINFSMNPPYKPSKETVAALSIGLKLSLKEAEDFYGYAGFHLGETEFVDRVIRFFIGKGIYRIYDVNYCMVDHGYPPLGEKARGEKY